MMPSVAEAKVNHQPETLEIGGSKGHMLEIIDGNILKLYKAYRWKMIPRCTGRYTCRDHSIVSNLRPSKLIDNAFSQQLTNNRVHSNTKSVNSDETKSSEGKCAKSSSSQREWECQLSGREDPIIVLPLDDENMTGIITYVKKAKSEDDGLIDLSKASYVHTLNSRSGFRRKLEAVGICMTNDGKFEVSSEIE